ncbi:MAG: response regulator [Deltaproteobacteria bacterium]|nr:response regulator [Deltaproteobacteria bacterium]
MADESDKKDKRVTVLIAEDNASARRCLNDHLEALGYNVVAAAGDGETAVEEARRLKPALAILDVKMPGMGGFEAAKEISSFLHIPIIIVSGYSSDELTNEAVEAGVFAYLVKPVTRKQLLPGIKLALARYEQFKKLKDEVKDLRDAVEARKLIERAKGILMRRCKIGEEEAFKLLQAHSQKENKKMKDIAEMIVEASKLI